MIKRAALGLLISVLFLVYLVEAVEIKLNYSLPSIQIGNETFNQTFNLTPSEVPKTEIAVQETAALKIYNIYLSPSGNDNNLGTVYFPIKTLEKAREKIRNLQPLEKNINVYLRGGTYNLDMPFVLDSEKDSGTSLFSINYQSYPGEKAVISGGQQLKPSWQLFNSNIYVSDVSGLVDKYGFFNSLFVNEKRATRARLPDMGYYQPTKFDSENNSAFYFKTGEINPNWKNLNDIEIVASRNWIQSRFKIKKIDSAINKVYLSGKSNPYYFGFGQDRYYIENVFEGMSEGEWYLDKQTKKLYYWPKAGEKIGSLEFIVPVTKTLIEAGNLSDLKEKSDFDYLEINEPDAGDPSLNLNQNFSISMWIKVEKKFPLGQWIISKGDPWNNKGFGIYVENGNVKVAMKGTSRILPQNSCTLTENQWAHCVFTVNMNSGAIKFYQNGLYSSEAKLGSIGDTSTKESLIIGKLIAEGFSGSIDELKLYNRVLTGSEINKLASNQPISNDKLALSLAFEDNLDDEKGNLPLVYGNPKFVPGKYGKALSFQKRTLNESFEKYLTNVNFKNLIFSYTDWKIPNKGCAGSQSDYYLENPAVILIEKNSKFENNEISHTGGYALGLYSKNIEITNNQIYDTGAGAIRAGGIGNFWNYKIANEITNSNIIKNNKINDIGKVFRASPAICIYHSGNNQISHNEIYNTSYTGISVGWWTVMGWDVFMKNNRIEYNKIYNNMKSLNDGGGIYVLGKQPSSLISNNIIHDVVQTPEHLSSQYLFGIYFDNAEDMQAKNNLVYRTGDSGIIFFSYLPNPRAHDKNNSVENNIFVDAGRHETFFNSYEDKFAKNIVYSSNRQSSTFFDIKTGIINYSDYNLFFKEDGSKAAYKFRNKQNQAYFYTTSEAEKKNLIDVYSSVWAYEGIAFYAYPSQVGKTLPVYRFWNKKTGVHIFTASEAEKNKLRSSLYSYYWVYEGIAFYAYPDAALSGMSSEVSKWKQAGYDAKSVISNPLFVDYKNDNFNLKPESPAYKLGFQKIDFSGVGPI